MFAVCLYCSIEGHTHTATSIKARVNTTARLTRAIGLRHNVAMATKTVNTIRLSITQSNKYTNDVRIVL